jgi:hypothetical protein
MAVPFLNTAPIRPELSIPQGARVVAAVVVEHPRGMQPTAPRAAASTSCRPSDDAHHAT